MKNKRLKTNNAVFESMLHEACAEAAKEFASEESSDNSAPDFSDEHKANMKALFEKAEKKQKQKKFIKASKMAACVLLALSVVSFTTIFSVKSMRNKFLNFFFNKNAEYTEFSGEKYEPVYIDGYVMNYVPEGFKLIEKQSDEYFSSATFEKDNETLVFNASCVEGGKKRIDTENSIVEEFELNGCDAVYCSNENTNILLWSDGNNYYTLTSKLNKSVMKKIAENIKLK